MVDASQSAPAAMTGQVLFYRKPEPLSAEVHGKLGMKRLEQPLMFAKSAHVVPVTVGEFGPAALSYPIIFAGEEKTPLIVMGVREHENLFIDDKGQINPENYLPAFVRRYPFVFAEDKAQDRFVVCVDTQADSVTEGGDVPFFENGQPTKFTQDAIEFLKTFEQQRQVTSQLVSLLKEHDLFEIRSVTFTPRNPDGTEGQPQKVAEYFCVTNEKLNALPADVFVQLRDNGALQAIFSHQQSLLNWQKVLNRALRPSDGAPVGNA